MQAINNSNDRGRLLALVDETWNALVTREPYYATRVGHKMTHIPSYSLDDVFALSHSALKRLEALDSIDVSGLNRTDTLTYRHLKYWLKDEAEEPQRWWTAFAFTPYNASALTLNLSVLFPGIDLASASERDRYIGLAADFCTMIEAATDRTVAQAQRGWRVPKPALPGVRQALKGLLKTARAELVPKEGRASSEFISEVQQLLDAKLDPAVARALKVMGHNYEEAAPERIGLCNQPNGLKAYKFWMSYHLSFDADPLEVHETGKSEVAHLAREMEIVRQDFFGFSGTEAEFTKTLRNDPLAKVASPEELEARFRTHLMRMNEKFPQLIRKAPKAKPNIARLAPELEAGMTFGYYEPPRGPGQDGIYYFSGNGIPDRLQLNSAPLIFHELMPGHHIHIARQNELSELPNLRRQAIPFSTFNEGWAEYSAGLAEECGLYGDPYDMYGWLSHQRFVAQRLVVDTGINALGWTMDQACAYMAANTLESDAQIRSEILRYGTDMPGQALAYRMGFLKFRELREKAKNRLGNRFDLRDFHEAILSEGSLPIAVLETSLDDWALEAASEDI